MYVVTLRVLAMLLEESRKQMRGLDQIGEVAVRQLRLVVLLQQRREHFPVFVSVEHVVCDD